VLHSSSYLRVGVRSVCAPGCTVFIGCETAEDGPCGPQEQEGTFFRAGELWDQNETSSSEEIVPASSIKFLHRSNFVLYSSDGFKFSWGVEAVMVICLHVTIIDFNGSSNRTLDTVHSVTRNWFTPPLSLHFSLL
jgi:hypothetical protein